MEDFIQESIESVLSQTYQHWELLLVDDGSTDRSSEIARNYARKYADRIYYLEHEHHQNKGKSTSRNLGISHAQGKYLAFLDADDIFLPLKLEQQLACLKDRPAARMVYGNTLYWYSWKNGAEDPPPDYMPVLGMHPNTLVRPPSLVRLLLGQGGTVPCICSFLVERDLVRQIGGFEETIQHLYEDQVFLAKIFLAAPVFIENGCWEKYRQRADSSWHLSLETGEDERARSIFLKWLETYLATKGWSKTSILQAFQSQRWYDRYPILSKIAKIGRSFRFK
jgi:GT2 family glycosyltransferase